MATKVGTVEIDVDVGTGKLQEGWNRADAISRRESARLQAQAVALGSTIGTVLGNGITKGISVLVDQARRGTDALVQIGKMSEQFGISTQTLSALRRETTLSGVSFDALGMGVRQLTVAASTNSSVFKAMGLSVKDGAGNLKSTETLITDIAGKFSHYEDSAAKAALAQRLFGEEGTRLIPVLDKIGQQGLDGITEQARAAGAVLGGDAAAGAKEFQKNLNVLADAGNNFSTKLASEMLPALNQAAKLATDPEFLSALGAIAEAIGVIADKAVEASGGLAKMYNEARAGVGVHLFENNITNKSEYDAASREAADLRKGLSGNSDQLLDTAFNSWNPGEVVSSLTTMGRIGWNGKAASQQRLDQLQQAMAKYQANAPSFKGVTGSYVGTVDNKLDAAPMIPAAQRDVSGSLAAAAKAQADAQRQLADLTERLQGQVAGPATQAWDAYAHAVREAAEAGGKQIEAAEKQVKLGDTTVSVAKVTAEAQDQVEKAVKAAAAAFAQYRRDADKAFNTEMADVEASISRPTKALTEQTQAVRTHERALESLFDRQQKGVITMDQYNTGVVEYRKLLDQRLKDIEDASDQVNQFELEAARNIQDSIADTFESMYTDIGSGLDGIADNWGKLLIKMASQAQAASVGKYLFGDYGSQGKIGGLVGTALSAFTGGASQTPTSTYNNAGFVSHVDFNSLGNVYSGLPSLSAMSSKVYNSPQVFAFANGAGVLGEAGDEAIMPLKRGADGKLGVRMSGSMTPSMGLDVTIINNTPAKVTTKQGTGQDGMPSLSFLIDAVDAGLADKNNTGSSRFGNSIAQRTGSSMAATL